MVYRKTFESSRPYEREFSGIKKFEPISRSHDSLIDVLHVGRSDEAGYFYYVMELADDSKVGQASSLSGVDGSSDAKTGKMAVPLFKPHTLRSELKQHGAFPMDRVLEIAHALASALAHLHAHKLVHRVT